MKNILIEIVSESIEVTFLVLLMMVTVDLINIKSKGKLSLIVSKTSEWKKYVIGSFLGSVPGCLGSFAGVSLYLHGMISFGSLTGLMIATSGDEAFVMLSLFPKTAIILFAILFLLGMVSGKLIDLFSSKFNLNLSKDCQIEQYHKVEVGYKHFLKEHVWHHLIKHHIWKTFLWTFGALLVVKIALSYWDITGIATQYIWLIIIFSAIIGLIPESGPNLIFISLFASGVIPFSVLLTNSIVQDGHGMLPMFSYSVKDSVKIKLFNFVIGLFVGSIVLLSGF